MHHHLHREVDEASVVHSTRVLRLLEKNVMKQSSKIRMAGERVHTVLMGHDGANAKITASTTADDNSEINFSLGSSRTSFITGCGRSSGTHRALKI